MSNSNEVNSNSHLKRNVIPVGSTILHGKYKILKALHTKGMANVYLVEDTHLGKPWCLKEIRLSEAGSNMVEYHSLLQEANILKTLNMASIPRITTIEQDGDSLFIIMDYVEGMSVKEWIVRKGSVNQDVAVTWMKQVTQIMIYLHSREKPIFYRDMKPDNLMIQQDGNIKLIDFGVSIVIEKPGQRIEKALGTRGYAAPEQSKRGNVCDLRSDIYALGKTMYYMLTGINPSQVKKSKLKTVREVNSSIAVGLDNIVNKCIQENPDDRYQSCVDLLYDLQNYQSLDTKYIKRAKRKCYATILAFVLSITLIVTSFIPLNLYKKGKEDEYNRRLIVAEQSSREEDYLSALSLKATDIEPYLGLIDSIKADGVFSEEEEYQLLNYMNPNIQSLQNSQDYGSLAFNMGKLYWFYYNNSNEEGMLTSIKWFKDAVDAGCEVELATVYYQLGMFKKTILSSVAESSDAGLYKEYWNNLLRASEVENGELVNLQLNSAIASCISSYAYNLKVDKVPYEEVNAQINRLSDFVKNYQPSIDSAQETYNNLKESLPSLHQKVDSVYGGGQ